MLIKMFKSVSKHFSGNPKDGGKVERTKRIIVDGKTILDEREESTIPISHNTNPKLPLTKNKKSIEKKNNNHSVEDTKNTKDHIKKTTEAKATKKKTNVSAKTKASKSQKTLKEKKKMQG